MKRFLLVCLISAYSTCLFSQVSEKELDNVGFIQMDDGNGGMMYGFSLNDKLVGPNYNIKGDGMRTYNYFNTEGMSEGFQMIENPATGEMTLVEKENDKMNGNAFKMEGANLSWAQTYKDGVIHKVKEVAYTSGGSNREGCRGNCMDGFGLYQAGGGQIVIGYFHKWEPATPVIHIFSNSDSMYQGAMKKWEREGFGKYTYGNDKSYYIGMWKKNKREGLGIWFYEDGSIKSKGYYKKDELIKNM